MLVRGQLAASDTSGCIVCPLLVGEQRSSRDGTDAALDVALEFLALFLRAAFSRRTSATADGVLMRLANLEEP
jgi:hypothetical protein